ncbi:uncharacterized protein FTOL_02559 [Fusarium torulosum]|uniref:Uncharacterized protein n=1 Tax=Fusarium torulosum TaxID=33205 RepID=A0AAE8M206_9HYPO|nr:uncharacterized protein FTOL_02559 [Fusarium torulosum]
MGSDKKSSKKKKEASREYSMELGTEKTFPNMRKSSVRQGTQDSDESWLRFYLADNTPTPMPKGKHAIRSQSQESDVISFISPEKLKIKPARELSVANIKSKGTGPHDNKFAKAQGNYREPSLRRGSGMPYDTPDAFRKITTTEIADNGHDGAQSTESVAGPSSQNPQPSSGQKPNGNDPYEIGRPKAQRGDLNPVGHRPLAAVKKTAPVQDPAPPRHTNKKNDDEKKQNKATGNQKPEKLEDPVTRPSDYIADEKESILKICLTLKDIFISHPPNCQEKEFWEDVTYKLPIHSQYKNSWRTLRLMVNGLCRPRRNGLRDGTLDKSTNTGAELHTLIDQWNEVYARRFCRENRGFLDFADERPAQEPLNVPKPATPQCEPETSVKDFDNKIWPAVKEILIPFAESKILEVVENKLQERMEELELLIRPPVLKGNSSPETFHTYLNYLRGRIHAAGKNSPSIRKSEAVISLIADLLPGMEMNLRKQLGHGQVGNVEEHDGSSGMSNNEGHDESHEDAEDVEDDVSCYQPSILDSIEPRTPIVTPRVTAQLKVYESRYVEAFRAAEAQQKAEYEALQSLDDNGHEGNVLADDTKGLVIRNKLTDLAGANPSAPNTPERPARKKQCLEENQLGSSPPFSSISPEFPSIEQLFSSSMDRESSAITQPSPAPARSSFGTIHKRKTLHGSVENAGPTPKATMHAQESPGLFVTPDPSLSGQSDKVFKFKKSVSRSVVPGKKRASENERHAEVSRFREETAEYQALSPTEREIMMYRAIRDMRGQ